MAANEGFFLFAATAFTVLLANEVALSLKFLFDALPYSRCRSPGTDWHLPLPQENSDSSISTEQLVHAYGLVWISHDAASCYGRDNKFFRRANMLYWALVFLVVAIIAGVLGFTGMAVAAAGVAKILFIVFLVLFLVSLVAHLGRGATTR